MQARRFRFCLGGAIAPPKQNSIGEQITKSGEQVTHRLTPWHVLGISNGTVKLPEYILTNSHFQLKKNEIVIEYQLLAILSMEYLI